MKMFSRRSIGHGSAIRAPISPEAFRTDPVSPITKWTTIKLMTLRATGFWLFVVPLDDGRLHRLYAALGGPGSVLTASMVRRPHGHSTRPCLNVKTISSHRVRRRDFCRISRSRFLTTCSVVPVRSAIVRLGMPAATSTRIAFSRSVNARRTNRPLSVIARAYQDPRSQPMTHRVQLGLKPGFNRKFIAPRDMGSTCRCAHERIAGTHEQHRKRDRKISLSTPFPAPRVVVPCT